MIVIPLLGLIIAIFCIIKFKIFSNKCLYCGERKAVSYEHGIPMCNECLPHHDDCPSLKTGDYEDCSMECWSDRYTQI